MFDGAALELRWQILLLKIVQERLEAILHQVGVVPQHIDIAEDDNLLERYSMRIPVLRRADSGAELGWPFDAAAVAQFLT